MSELDPKSRAFVDRALRASDPEPDVEDRVLARIIGVVGSGPPPGGGLPSEAPISSAASTGAAVSKAAAIVALPLAAAVAWAAGGSVSNEPASAPRSTATSGVDADVQNRSTPRTTPVSALPQPELGREFVPTAPESAVRLAGPGRSTTPAAELGGRAAGVRGSKVEPSRSSTSRSRSQQPLVPVPDSGPEPEPNPRVEATSELEQRPPATDTLLTELASVSSARRSLRSSKPAEALARIRRYQRERPAGQLADEAAAIEILALCQLGRDEEARQRGGAFFKHFPTSLQRSKVEKSCATQDGHEP